MPDTKNVIDALTSRPLALTTFRLKDADSANRYQTAIARGDDELLFWGLGPRLEVGNLVALYVPNSTFVPRCDRMTISRVYSVSHIIEGRKWPNYVYLGQPLVFDPFRLEDLRVKIGLSDFEIRDSGSKKNAWEKARAQKFWSFILKRQANLETVARERLLQKHLESRYDVAISYAGPDWTEARRLKRWFDHEGLQTFFATSVGTLNNEGRQTLPELLRRVYRQSRVAIFLTPPPDFMSEWIRIELEAAIESANRVILVRFDTSRKWQLRPSRKVERLDYKPPEEDLVVKRVLSHLRNIGKMQGSSGRGASLQPIGPGPFDG